MEKVIILIILLTSSAFSTMIEYENEIPDSVNLTIDNPIGSFFGPDHVDDFDSYDSKNIEESPLLSARRYIKPWTRHSAEIHGNNIKHNVVISTKQTIDLKKKWVAFCAGSIISEKRILTAASCFYTNLHKLKRPIKDVNVIVGLADTPVKKEGTSAGVWHNISTVHVHPYFRHHSYNLAVAVLSVGITFSGKPFTKSGFAQSNIAYNGVCKVPVAMPVRSWIHNRRLFYSDMRMMSTQECSSRLMLITDQYYCTAMDPPHLYKYAIQGAGLFCYATGDSGEQSAETGVVVGVTTAAYDGIGILHTKTAFSKDWIESIKD